MIAASYNHLSEGRKMEDYYDNTLQKTCCDHRDTYVIRLVIGAVALLVFFLMHYFYTSEISEDFDLAVSETLRSIRSPELSAILIPITHMANWRILVGIGAVLLIIDAVKWHKADYPLAVLSCLITLVLYKTLKVLAGRPRPDEIFWLVAEHGYSFPSGHSMNGMFCYGMMIYVLWRNCPNRHIRNIVTAVLCALIPLIAFSRVYCGVHYPTDVIGGMSMGLAMLMASTVIIDEILLRYDQKKNSSQTISDQRTH